MNAAAVQGLISRRGSVVQWAHASPLPVGSVNPLTGGPISTGLGGTGIVNEAAMGESYTAFFPIRGYFTNKTSSSSFQKYGIVEQGDAQLDFAVPYVPDFDACSTGLPPVLLEAYNSGQFAIVRKSATTVTYDRFKIDGTNWIAKAVAVPLVDSNITFAWRVLICKETY